jgi:REP element-mobilizing transposase RayT
MQYNPEKHHRRSIRLKGYDYSAAGAYFITLCTYQRQYLFGEIMDGAMHLNPYGKIVEEGWLQSSTIRQEIELDAWVIMPDHMHGIVVITNHDANENVHIAGAHGRVPPPVPQQQYECLPPHCVPPRKPQSISSFVAGFKSAVTKRINILRDTPGTPVWQRNYYERIIRDESALNHIRRYIQMNPINWELDRFYRAHS